MDDTRKLCIKLVEKLDIFKDDVEDILNRYFSFKDNNENRGLIKNAPKIVNGHPKPVGYLPYTIKALSEKKLLFLGESVNTPYAFVRDFFRYPKVYYDNRYLGKRSGDLAEEEKNKINDIIDPYEKLYKTKLGSP